ncbi:MAG: nucleotidyl transferase AbiEii/AbiGii toxin family protein [Proteobacteria bacterium]|nr:nucleotidyl transferase AbiEii/AbiGii toxin family protein [Pseudomonadota bacterium]
MAFDAQYRRQVALLLRVLPLVAEEACFALKGGTAINLFVRDLPRLSVDIDLTYLPVEPRPKSLAAIDAAMKRIAQAIRTAIRGSTVAMARVEGTVSKLTVRANGAQTKIEVTPVLRGTVYEPEIRAVTDAVQEQFGFAEIQVVSFADLYAGKLVAALDRQHPRDLFDVRDLLANEGITDELRRAFVVYMISHDRPMSEVLRPTLKALDGEYAQGFDGMTETPIPLEALSATRDQLIAQIVDGMPQEHRDFLISFERGEPDWILLGLPGAADLPAVKWRQLNLDKLTGEKRTALVTALQGALRKR